MTTDMPCSMASFNTTPSLVSVMSTKTFQELLSSKIIEVKKETDFGAFDEGLVIPWVFAFTVVHWAFIEIIGTCLLLGVIKVNWIYSFLVIILIKLYIANDFTLFDTYLQVVSSSKSSEVLYFQLMKDLTLVILVKLLLCHSIGSYSYLGHASDASCIYIFALGYCFDCLIYFYFLDSVIIRCCTVDCRLF